MKLSGLISGSFSFALALLSFAAMYRPTFLGYLAASPGILLLLLPLFFHLILIIAGKAKWGLLGRESLLLILFGLVMSLMSALIFDYQAIFLRKTFNLMLLTTIWLSPLILSGYIKNSHIYIASGAGILLGLIGFFFEIYPSLMPNILANLVFADQFIINVDGRPRGFTSEASQYSTMLFRFLLIFFLVGNFGKKYKNSSFNLFCILLCVVAFVIQSKGAIVSLVVSYLYAITTKRHALVAVCFVPLLAVLLLPIIFNMFIYDLENFSSSATRSVLAMTVFLGVLYNPFGYGFYGFYPAFSSFGSDVILRMDGLAMNFSEVNQIVGDLVALSSKSTILDFLMLFGIAFVVFLIRAIRLIDLTDPRGRFALILLILTSLFTSGHDSIFFFLGLLIVSRMSNYRVTEL